MTPVEWAGADSASVRTYGRYPLVGQDGYRMTRINVGVGTEIRPVLFTGYESRREAQTIVHPILGSKSADITLRPAQYRTGELEMLFTDEAASITAERSLASGEVCTLWGQERGSAQMWFVVTGEISRILDDDDRDVWLVRFGFQEIDPIPWRYLSTPGKPGVPS